MKIIAILPVLLYAACSACDGAMSDPIQEFRIRHRPADQVAKALTDELVAERGIAPHIEADLQANSVIVGPALQADLIRIKRRIKELDVR